MVAQPHQYMALKAQTAQQNPPPAAAVQNPGQDNQTVAQATQGMNWEQKYHWLNGQLNQVAADMQAKGIPVDKRKYFDASFIEDLPDAAAVMKSQKPSSIGDPIKVYNYMFNVPVKDLRTTLAHEISHTQQPYTKNKHQEALNEKAADHDAARTYGAQATIDMLQHLAEVSHTDTKKQVHGDPHESIRKRQERIAHDFPDEHAVVPKYQKAPEKSPKLPGHVM
jgi:hypothetical protein